MAIRTANTQSLTEITAFPSAVALGGLILLATETASSSDLVTFDSGIDSTYKEYIFTWVDAHPATDQADLQVNFRDGSTAYDATKTTTNVQAFHDEADTSTGLAYDTGRDLAQATGIQILATGNGYDNDQDACGTLHLFNPSSTTFVKHFMGRFSSAAQGDAINDLYVAGYINTTSAIDEVQFAMSSGNIDAGTFKLYGVN